MATVRDLINGSLRLLHVIAHSESATASEVADALSSLNSMIESWSNENLLIHSVTREEFSLVAGTAAYTIGTGGTLNTTRPMRIERAGLEVQGDEPFEKPIEIINLDRWADISMKGVSSEFPEALYFEETYPLATLHLWPVPSSAEKLVLYSLKPLSSFASANDTLSLPQGYERALRYCLAVEIAPEYGKEPNSVVAFNAANAKSIIKRSNAKPVYLSVDPALLCAGGFDIKAGE